MGRSANVNIVLLGAPGSGKGTQGERLRQRLKLRHIATGELFRGHLRNRTALGKLAREYMDRGQLVPDQTTVRMLREYLEEDTGETSCGALFDGFPRTLEQARALEDLLAERGGRLDGVIYIRVGTEEIVRRLSGRLMCSRCQASFHRAFKPFVSCPTGECKSGEYLYQRDDDRPSTVRRRLETFHDVTAPLVEFYRTRGLLCEVDGEGTVDEVTSRVLETIDQIRMGVAG